MMQHCAALEMLFLPSAYHLTLSEVLLCCPYQVAVCCTLSSLVGLGVT